MLLEHVGANRLRAEIPGDKGKWALVGVMDVGAGRHPVDVDAAARPGVDPPEQVWVQSCVVDGWISGDGV